MIRACVRATCRSPVLVSRQHLQLPRCFSSTQWREEDPRLDDFGRKITDEFAQLRDKYGELLHTFFITQHTEVLQQRQ
jgi:triacylglycerol lipase